MSTLPWTFLKKKQKKLAQTLPSSWLESFLIILLQIFVWDTWFSLSVLLKPQLWEFSHLQSQEQNRCSGSHKLLQRSCPQPQLHCMYLNVNLGRQHVFKLQRLHTITKVSERSTCSISLPKQWACSPHPTFVKQIPAHLNYISKILGMRPKFILCVQFKWTM